MFQQRRRRGPGLGLVLLAAQLFNVGFDRIPPVTLSVIGLNVGVYLKLLSKLPRLGKACVSAEYVWDYGDWKRLLLASFYHLDDWHLYYNMASFVWKGISLERSLGSAGFLYVLAVFSVLTNVVLVALDVLFASVLGDPSYLYTCAAGFSGVIFALKVLTTYDLPSGVSYVMGMFPVPVRYACWAELLLIQLLVPNASFTGHLAGILVGFMYVKGPLKPVMNSAAGIVSGGGARTRHFGQPSYTYHSSATGTRQSGRQARDNEDEQLQSAIQASLQDTHRHPATPPSEDPALQSAIGESLRSSSQANTGMNLSRGPSQGGPYLVANQQLPQEGARLYPRVPQPQPAEEQWRTNIQPSAPLAGNHDNRPASDHDNRPAGNHNSQTPYPLHNTMPSPDDLRQMRLRHFDR